MFIQCFIQKIDGSDVFVDFEGVRYIFTRNAIGDAVCFVGNQAHAKRLLMMGELTYIEYPQERLEMLQQHQQPGGAPVVLGGAPRRREPEAKEPLPDNLSVDDALAQGGQVESAPVESAPVESGPLNPTAAEGVAKAEAELKEKEALEALAEKKIPPKETKPAADPKWMPEAIEHKINEFKFKNKPQFKQFVDDNASNVMDWPIEVRTELAKKLAIKFPEHDPGIEGFIINDYLGNDTGDS